MPDTPTGSGLDLARQALAAYKATAKNTPSTKTARRPRRSARTRSGDGRDPLSLGAVLNRVSAEQGWKDSMGGGDLLGRWAVLCPQFADTVRPEGFDAESGTLTLRPMSHTIASGIRILGGQLAKQINDKLDAPLIARIRILPVGAAPHLDQAAPGEVNPVTPKVSPEPPAHYVEGAKAARAGLKPRTPSRVDTAAAEAGARQEAILRAHREPLADHRNAAWEAERVAQPQPTDRSEEVRRAALEQKRREAAGVMPRRVFDVA